MVDKDKYYECTFVHDIGGYKIIEPVLVRKDHTGCIRNATFKKMENLEQGKV